MNAETTDYVTAMGTTVPDDDVPPGMFDLDELRAQSIRETAAIALAVPALLVAFVALWIMLP